MQRVVDQGDLRPMAGHDDALSDLKRILSEREPFYRRAHLVLDSSGRTVAECVDELVGKVAGAANPDAAASTGESVRGDMAEHVAQRSPGRVS
jgi:shikimate kinase